MMRIRLLLQWSMVSSVAFWSALAQAACTIAAGGALSFGSYSPYASTPTDGVTTVTVTCNLPSTYSVGLSAGSAPGATVTSRKMSAGANRMAYGLYRDAARTLNWGQTVGVDVATGTVVATPVTHTIYGRIPALQNLAPGAYADTIIATVNF